jgi:hypothetical protein
MQAVNKKEISLDNMERLRSHLKNDSLAEKLLVARAGAGSADPRPAMRAVVLAHIEELKRGYELPDHKA